MAYVGNDEIKELSVKAASLAYIVRLNEMAHSSSMSGANIIMTVVEIWC